jgi:hypothetical protein
MNMNNYTSRDFYLSAYLLAVGHALETYRKDTTGKTTFVFQSTPELNKQIQKYYGLDALVNPVEYANALRSLKSMIHAEQVTNEDTYYVKQYKDTK